MNLLKKTEHPASENQLFPIFLKLNTLHTLVVGGGSVGLEKVTAIMRNCPQASLTIVSKTVSEDLRFFAKGYSTVTIIEKPFAENDLDGVDLVVVATDNPEVNAQVKEASRRRRLLVNVADKPELCDFYLGSVVQKGALKLGISTNGKSPTVAKRLREVLNEALPDELEEVLANLNNIRNKLTGDFALKVRKLNEITRILIEAEKQDFLDPEK